MPDINKYTTDEIDKLGNTLIYLSNRIHGLTKTKALKLLYLLDEIAIKKYGIPLVGLSYEVWQYGPVPQDVYIELTEAPLMLKSYIDIKKEFSPTLHTDVTLIIPKKDFSDDEFTDNDMTVLEYVVDKFGVLSANELSNLTHKPTSLWYKTAKEHHLLDAFESGKTRSSNLIIDFSILLDQQKQDIYKSYLDKQSLERSFNV